MYDMDNDGVITKNELVAFLTLMVGSNVSQGKQATSEIIDVDEAMTSQINIDFINPFWRGKKLFIPKKIHRNIGSKLLVVFTLFSVNNFLADLFLVTFPFFIQIFLAIYFFSSKKKETLKSKLSLGPKSN